MELFKSKDELTLTKLLRMGVHAVLRIVGVSGAETSVSGSDLAKLSGFASLSATVAEINNAADVSARVQALTASGAITAGVQSIQLAHNSTVIASTIASLVNHPGLLVIKNTSASGTAAHTVTVTTGTLNGTNKVATLNAPGEALVIYVDSAGNGTLIANIGEVALSG
jgi:flagellar capping protein FliD